MRGYDCGRSEIGAVMYVFLLLLVVVSEATSTCNPLAAENEMVYSTRFASVLGER